MFAPPSTPRPQTRYGTWPRYIAGLDSTSYPHVESDLFTQPQHSSLSVSQQQQPQRTNSISSSIGSLSSPDLSHSSPLTRLETLQTPFVRAANPNHAFQTPLRFPPSSSPTSFAARRLPEDLDLHMSPIRLSSYPDTPSPPAAYGINGGMIVAEPPMLHSIHSESGGGSCTPITSAFHPSSTSSFPSKASSRPVLRPSLSHNAVFQTPSPSWQRRMMSTTTTSTAPAPNGSSTSTTSLSTGNIHQSDDTTSVAAADRPRLSAAGGTLLHSNTSSFNQPQHQSFSTPGLSSSVPTSAGIAIPGSQHAHPHQQHEASNTSGFATLASSAPTSSSQPHSYPTPTHITALNNGGIAYNDDLSFHTTSYAGSYDSSFSSATTGSPWSNPSPHHSQQPMHPGIYPHPHSMYGMYPPAKQIEPVLAPGEVPAPRPPMSYAALIGEALLLAPPPHALYVSEISDSIKKRYAYYRQNPTKIYNGVRHQTSMCKAFVKLPRPFGDQSGGARKWAIRAGCESWFHSGGYHPPITSPTPSSGTTRPGKATGKAKATARAKQLAIGTTSPGDKKSNYGFEEAPWSAGPSSGPAYDGTGRPFNPYPQPSMTNPQYLPPGYHYVPVQAAHGHPHPPNQAVFVPVWGPYQAPPPPSAQSSAGPAPFWSRTNEADNSSSPEHWEDNSRRPYAPSEHGSIQSLEEKPMSPHSMQERRTPQRPSPEATR